MVFIGRKIKGRERRRDKRKGRMMRKGNGKGGRKGEKREDRVAGLRTEGRLL